MCGATPTGPSWRWIVALLTQQISDDRALNSELTSDFDFLYPAGSEPSAPQPLQAELRTMRADFVSAEESWMKSVSTCAKAPYS
jgi:hypothetical protein